LNTLQNGEKLFGSAGLFKFAEHFIGASVFDAGEYLMFSAFLLKLFSKG
jgi:hypothetical protein